MNTAINTNIDTNIDTNIATNLTTNKTYTSDVNKDVDVVVSDTYTSDVNKDVDLIYSDTFDRTTTANHAIDTSYSDTVDKSLTSDISYSDSFDRTSTANHAVDTSYSDTVDKSFTSDVSYSDTVDKSLTSDISYSDTFERTSTATHDVATTYNDNFDKNTSINTEVNKEFNASANIEFNWERNFVDTDIDHNEVVFVDHDITIDKEVDEHGVSAELESDLSLTSSINFTGSPTVSGDLEIDSAAIAVIDNRQATGGNVGANDELSNDASISDDVASEASGNLHFNVGAGDNNQQDNAAALSAADASFAFGLADSKVFVQQTGAGNQTSNLGVANTASVGDNAFNAASGNVGVNVTSGNNNQQKNSLAASVATASYASAAVSTNQVSAGNTVTNAPKVREGLEEVAVNLTGAVTGKLGGAIGSYSGRASGTYEGRGNAYQKDNFYLDSWNGALNHPNGGTTGHLDMDNEIQNAVANPYADGVGGIAFDTDEKGTWKTTEGGDITFNELGNAELTASLSGLLALPTLDTVSDASNSATLSGAAFQSATGNIGVNISAGTGNQQSNSLSLAVAQPGTGGPGG
ncbi:adhesin [Pseudoxanthomonas koreensis]|nr:adhesin [Pseudoxanthomonas koreensis]